MQIVEPPHWAKMAQLTQEEFLSLQQSKYPDTIDLEKLAVMEHEIYVRAAVTAGYIIAPEIKASYSLK